MKDIYEYIKLPQEERQAHLKLDELCIEQGGHSMYLKGLVAHLRDTTILDGKKIHVCHTCNKGKPKSEEHKRKIAEAIREKAKKKKQSG